MKRAISALIALGAAALLAAVLFGTGVVPVPGQQAAPHPPCEELPTRAEVEDALITHDDLVREIQAVGAKVQIDVGTPCSDEPDRALVRITYTEGADRDRIDNVMSKSGFGVPAQVAGG